METIKSNAIKSGLSLFLAGAAYTTIAKRYSYISSCSTKAQLGAFAVAGAVEALYFSMITPIFQGKTNVVEEECIDFIYWSNSCKISLLLKVWIHVVFTYYAVEKCGFEKPLLKTVGIAMSSFGGSYLFRDRNIFIGGDLNLRGYTSLTSLPEVLHVGGNLDLGYCKSLTSLPEGLHVDGELNLEMCTNLNSLPGGLHVDGNLVLLACMGLTSLPEGMHVGGKLNLCFCTSLTSLPAGLHVGGHLYLICNYKLRTLPGRLSVDGSLCLQGCKNLNLLPYGLHVGGDLDLRGCTSLTSLPEGLHVGGLLTLDGCTSLTSLPEGLYVGGLLTLDGCTSLTSLPEGLYVGGHLNLGGCTSLNSLPNWITALGPKVDGSTREVNLEGTGLSNATIERLRNTPAPGIQFVFQNSQNSNHLRVLRLSHFQNFTDRDVQKAFRKLALQHHPDKGGDPEMFREIVDAKDALFKYLEDRR